jgi:hypothetical protein
MFTGDHLESIVKGYVPRSYSRGEKWTHWKVLLIRERYSDWSLVDVRVDFYFARKLRGRWISGKKSQFSHFVHLGDLNVPGENARLLTVDDIEKKTKMKVAHELKRAFTEIKKDCENFAKRNEPIKSAHLTFAVKGACWKKSAE